MIRVLAWGLVPFAFVAAFAGTSFASQAGDGESILDVAKPVLDALLAGQPGLAAALALVLFAAVARRYGTARFTWLASDAGGAAVVLIGAFGGAAAAALSGGASWSLALAWAALKNAFLAAGGYSMVKRLLVTPLLKPLRDKLPTWLRPVLDLVLAIFEPRVAKAAAAGDAAVAAKPSTGAAGVVGEPRDVP